MKKKNKELNHRNLHNLARYATMKKTKMSIDQWDRFKILWAPFIATQMLTPKKNPSLNKKTMKIIMAYTDSKLKMIKLGPEAARSYRNQGINCLRQVFRSEKEIVPV